MRAGFKRVLFMLVRIFALVVVGLWGTLYFAQTPMIFKGERKLGRTPAFYGWKYEDVSVKVGREATCGWYIPVDQPKGVVLLCHGNDGNVSTHLTAARVFHDMGFSVLIFDYGGYGKSTGGPSEQRAYADAAAMWSYLTVDKKLRPNQIVIWGPSFGGGPATELATHAEPAAVILQSTYLSIPKAAFGKWAWLAKCFIRHQFDNESKVSRIKSPLLVIHSPDDTLYPFEHGRRLYELATAPKQFLEIRGDHYNGTPLSAESCRTRIEAFLGPLLSPK
jgi:fermentation-respiration switch protein FrsA (DUF1100 family)